MNINKTKDLPSLLLALHSSTETFGVGFIDYSSSKKTQKTSIFPIGRDLSNKIFSCVEQVLPAKDWKYLARIAVATGPGGFTGTRLSVAMARTLSEQIGCPLDGISSFELMAPRLSKSLNNTERENPFWITKELTRRGTIGGQYKIIKKSSTNEIEELKIPHLIKKEEINNPQIQAVDDVGNDIKRLLKICEIRHKMKQESLWENVLPIYPTSPVEKI